MQIRSDIKLNNLFIRSSDLDAGSNSSTGHLDKTRIALVLFSNQVDVILDLNDSATRSELWMKIARIEKLGEVVFELL